MKKQFTQSYFRISGYLLAYLLIQCAPQQQSSDDSAALGLLLLEGNPVQNQNRNADCAIRENSITNAGADGIQVNASSTRCWMLVSLRNGGTQIAPGGDWDLRLRRFVIGTNSGESGSGSGGACDTGSGDFTEVNSPTFGNCSDSANFKIDSVQTQGDTGGNADVNDSANPVLFEWYAYNETVLTPKNNVYIIRGGDGIRRFKLQMTGYYSLSGSTSGYPRFRWSEL